MRRFAGVLILVVVLGVGTFAQDAARPALKQWNSIETFAADQYFEYGTAGSIVLKGTRAAVTEGSGIDTGRISVPPRGSFIGTDDALRGTHPS